MNIMGTSSPVGWLKVLEHIPCNVWGTLDSSALQGVPPEHHTGGRNGHLGANGPWCKGPGAGRNKSQMAWGWNDPGLDLAANKVVDSNLHSPMEPRASSRDWGETGTSICSVL